MATTGNAIPMPTLELGQTYEFTTRQMFDYVDTGSRGWVEPNGLEMWTLYAFTSAPPPGMTVTTALFSGTPTTAGTYKVVLQYADRYNAKTRYDIPVTTGAPEPEPPPVADAKADVAALMGQPDNPDLIAVIDKALTTINAMVSAYTRGSGFTGGVPNKELRAVIQTATARLVANPEQVASTVGGVTTGAGFNGWSLAELAVLNRHRKRAL